MKSYQIADILSDMVHSEPDKSQDSRETLAEYIAGLEERIATLERSLKTASNIASCLANGIIPD